MHISWLGNTSIKLQTKNLDEDVIIILDAYKPAIGEFPRSVAANIALFSRGEAESIPLTQEPFILSTLGEVEIKGVMITGLIGEAGDIIYKISAENINIVHLGAHAKKPSPDLVEKMGTIDILLLPVGGGETTGPETAVEIMNLLEPRIVIPIAQASDINPDHKPVDEFTRLSGLPAEAAEKKLIIKKKDLPAGEMKLVVLEKTV